MLAASNSLHWQICFIFQVSTNICAGHYSTISKNVKFSLVLLVINPIKTEDWLTCFENIDEWPAQIFVDTHVGTIHKVYMSCGPGSTLQPLDLNFCKN